MLTMKFLGRFREMGLLLMRIGIGVSFILHGSGKMFAGPEMWEKLGGSMAGLGVTFAPTLWGFLAAFAEFGGGILMILGFVFRPAMLMMFFTMLVATHVLYSSGKEFGDYSHPLKMAFVFLGLLFVGPGKLSIDKE